MIYITTTDWKRKCKNIESKLVEIVTHYTNDTDVNRPVKSLIESIDNNQYDVYYTVMKESIESFLNDEDLSTESKLKLIQYYLNFLL